MSALGITEADTELHPVKAWLETSVPPAPSTETPLGEDTQADGQKAAQHGASAADPLAGEPSSPAFDPRPQPGSPDRVSGIGRDPATHPLTPKSPPLQGPRSIMASLPSNRPESYYGEPPPRPEETIVELPPFHTIGVMALIINKMIGVGIFVTPPLVLMLTGSRWVSFWLWVAGGIYAIFG